MANGNGTHTNGNGAVVYTHSLEDRIVRLETLAQEHVATLAATSIKLEVAAEKISDLFEANTKAIGQIAELVNAHSERIAAIERAEKARATRIGMVKKGLGAALLAGSGAAATKLVALLLAHF